MAKAPVDDSTPTPEPTPPASPAPPQECGVVMPISALGDYPAKHWADVKDILFDAIKAAELKPNLVSDADDVGIIQKRIIQNLYENPIVVCDVSGKNPNVMFELGMRLAFDKPTVIVKDDRTAYSFDTAPIEHLEYPRGLHYQNIVDFKELLGNKLKATLQKATTDSSYTPFLGYFGKFTVAKLETHEVSKEEYILQEMKDLRRLVEQALPRETPRVSLEGAWVSSGPATPAPTKTEPVKGWRLKSHSLPNYIVPAMLEKAINSFKQQSVTDWEGSIPLIARSVAQELASFSSTALLPTEQELEVLVRDALKAST